MSDTNQSQQQNNKTKTDMLVALLRAIRVKSPVQQESGETPSTVGTRG